MLNRAARAGFHAVWAGRPEGYLECTVERRGYKRQLRPQSRIPLRTDESLLRRARDFVRDPVSYGDFDRVVYHARRRRRPKFHALASRRSRPLRSLRLPHRCQSWLGRRATTVRVRRERREADRPGAGCSHAHVYEALHAAGILLRDSRFYSKAADQIAPKMADRIVSLYRVDRIAKRVAAEVRLALLTVGGVLAERGGTAGERDAAAGTGFAAAGRMASGTGSGGARPVCVRQVGRDDCRVARTGAVERVSDAGGLRRAAVAWPGHSCAEAGHSAAGSDG